MMQKWQKLLEAKIWEKQKFFTLFGLCIPENSRRSPENECLGRCLKMYFPIQNGSLFRGRI